MTMKAPNSSNSTNFNSSKTNIVSKSAQSIQEPLPATEKKVQADGGSMMFHKANTRPIAEDYKHHLHMIWLQQRCTAKRNSFGFSSETPSRAQSPEPTCSGSETETSGEALQPNDSNILTRLENCMKCDDA